MPKTFFMLAGEASGDKHAAKLVAQLKAQSPGARCVGMGGPAMRAAGFEAFKDLDGMQVVGFWEVARQYGFFKKVFYELLDKVKQTRPDALICVDYPGFNLRFAKAVKKLGIPVLYYIVPQVWAWKALRAKTMAQYVDRAFCVFEFEPPFFEKFGLKTEFVGHPLMDSADGVTPAYAKAAPSQASVDSIIEEIRKSASAGTVNPAIDSFIKECISRAAKHKIVGLLPGSRDSEIRQHLQPMEAGMAITLKAHPDLSALISLPDKSAGGDARRIKVDFSHDDPLNSSPIGAILSASKVSHSYLIPRLADFSVVKSGTSTLEAGLAGNPLCVIYKGSAASFAIAQMLVNIPVFSLVNIVLGRHAVPELLQSEVNPRRIAAEIEQGLFDEAYRERQREALAGIPKKLGGPGASARAAKGMLDFLAGR